MICIYHNADLDGFCSAGIVKYKYPDVKLIGHNYGKKLDFSQIPENEEIIMSDISLPKDEYFKLLNHSNKKLIWIDHHISAINDYENWKDLKTGITILKVGKAACELTWEYLFPDKDIPLIVEYLGKYDTWRIDENWNDVILPFQYGMRLICNSGDSFPITLFNNNEETINFLKRIENNGKLILEYEEQKNKHFCKTSAFEAKIGDYRAICLNGWHLSSTVFESIYDENKHDIMVAFHLGKKDWHFTLYSSKKDIDCSQIAKIYGGGGHKGAAGFQIEDLKLIFKNN